MKIVANACRPADPRTLSPGEDKPQFQQISGNEASYGTARGYSTGGEVDGRR